MLGMVISQLSTNLIPNKIYLVSWCFNMNHENTISSDRSPYFGLCHFV